MPVTSLINGIAADYVSVNDRSLHYGDGIFETILCNKQHLLYWQQHYQRLAQSAKKLKITCPDEQSLLNDIALLLKQNTQTKTTPAVIKIILSRGNSERGYAFPDDQQNTRMVLLSMLDTAYSSLITEQLGRAELFVCQQQLGINESLAGLKHLNRLENVMARNEWRHGKKHYVDGLMLNANQHVIEGSMSNLFAVKNGQLFTPDLKLGGVNGIMRDMIIQLASVHAVPLSITNINMQQLLDMDELFISNSLLGMKSISKLGHVDFEQSTISQQIFTLLTDDRDNHAQAI